MAINGYFVESSLTTSEIWEGINGVQGSTGENTLQKVTNLYKTAKHITNTDIEAAYISLRQITDSITRAAMKAYYERKNLII